MLIAILCVLIVAGGFTIGYWHVISTWFRGGEAQIPVNLRDRGKRRHAPEHVRPGVQLGRMPDRPNHWRLVTLEGAMVVWAA